MSQYDALCRKAAVAHHERRHDDALKAFTGARSLDRSLPFAWNGIAAVLAEMGRLDESVSVLREAAEATGSSVAVLANLAIALEQQGCHDESIEFAEKVLAVAPDHIGARLTLGLALLKLGRFQDSVQQYHLLTKAHLDNADAFLNLGEALLASECHVEAVTAYERAIELDPTLIAARVGQGLALAMLRRFDEADACFADSARIAPEEALACFRRMAEKAGQRIPPGWQVRATEVFLSRRWAQQQVCDWRFRSEYIAAMENYADRLAVSGEATHDPSLVLQSSLVPITPFQRHSLLDALARGIAGSAGAPVRRKRFRSAGPLRLGFISSDFHDTPVAQLHWRQLSLHDRNCFSVHAYSLFEQKESVMRRKIVESVDQYHDLSKATAIEAAWKIARDGIDILVDLTGHLNHSRPEILALRPAPLRVSLIGGLTPIGKQFVDYKFTDPVTTPDESEFTEALVFLPDAYFIYNDQESIAGQAPTRSDCQLPEDAFVFCGFNSGFKIEPDVFEVWMRLLQDIPESVLWLREESSAMMDNLRREAEACGIRSKRLVFAPRMERSVHLARHACADLFLDTWICNAATTAADALWAGLPVLTRAGDTMGSRVAASLVTAAGLPELVMSSADDYRLLAYQLATSPEKLRRLRQRLIERRLEGQLFDTRRKVRQLERGFEMMWERHARGKSPASFAVPDDTSSC